MVSYSFQKRFVNPILAGTKRQTIRKPRIAPSSRHAREGDELQLYTGLRTKYCKLIGRATCIAVVPIRLEVRIGRVTYIQTGVTFTTEHELLDRFAQADGFTDWREMQTYWHKLHPGVDLFEGVLVRWHEIKIGPDFADRRPPW